MSYWLFQGNPKYFRVQEAIRDFEQMYWAMTRYAQAIAPGDGVLLWKAGEQAGIYAIASPIPQSSITEVIKLIQFDFNYLLKNCSELKTIGGKYDI